MYGQGTMQVKRLESTYTNVRTGVSVAVVGRPNPYTIQWATLGEPGDHYQVASLGPRFFVPIVMADDGVLVFGQSY
jgi:hypothetical protein